ncbi:MAG: hypothetical protein HXY50_09410 [Ignavibacteriaceae bacterium]|nr:hypothetical protein [Ignavibacteriaceae bacterium]
MKIKAYLIFLVIIQFTYTAFPQNGLVFDLFPSGLNFIPLKANNQEARLGVLYYTATTNLKVDIGNNVDLLALKMNEEQIVVAAGIEFMAYAFSRSYAGQRLQISAVDGFFGGNLSFSKRLPNSSLFARLRIIHNSAHLVDGSYDTSNDVWIDGKEPIPYTKDFGEITIAHQISEHDVDFKYYGGLAYATLVRPSELKRFNYHVGIETAFPKLLGKLVDDDVNLFLAGHFFLDGAHKYLGSSQLMLGIKIGGWTKKGVVFYTSYYAGRDMFSSYYDRRISKFGIGFSIDFI